MAKTRFQPKKVVYLWGAGATHAEARRLGSTTSLLMRDTEDFGDGITRRILRRAGRKAASSFGGGDGADIEKLISLLASSGTAEHLAFADKLRVNYFEELRSSLNKAKLFDDPKLAIDLLNMHNDPTFRNEVESLRGMISTNHDGLLQVASQAVYGGINPGFEFASKSFRPASTKDVPLILQLHGSFTWRFGLPLNIEKLHQRSPYSQTVWIPPTILKESKAYPFNKLTGIAYELLARECDVLRVVGTSLTQNDWNILSLIFHAQRHREATQGQVFSVELIMPREAGETIKRECAYLKNIRSIGYLTDGNFAEYKDDTTKIPPESDLANPLAYWLKEKVDYHQASGELGARAVKGRLDLIGAAG